MSCAQPIRIKNPHFRYYANNTTIGCNYPKFWKEYLEVPCNWCLNCRVDRQNWISDACEYEWKKYNYIGAFVTFTYDDIHLYENNNILPDDFYQFVDDSGKLHTMPFINNKPAQYSLKRDDARGFLKRLRSKIDYYYKKYDIKNIDLCRKDFMFIQCGEYGDLFGRPHHHFVFFGLDYEFCKDMLQECWEKGLIDVLPIQDGAFNYVSKYFTKQLCGKRAVEVYDDNGLERPYFCHSLGLGKGLILEQLDYIRSHNGCYLNKNDLLRPVPIYYKNALHIVTNFSAAQYHATEENMIQHNIKRMDNIKSYGYRYSLKQMNDYKHQQALLRHRKLEQQINNSGEGYEPLLCYKVGEDTSISILVENMIKDSIQNENYIKYHSEDFEKFSQYCDEHNIIPF